MGLGRCVAATPYLEGRGSSVQVLLVKFGMNTSLSEAPGGGSISVGLAELRPNDLPEELVGRADAALYRERQQARAGLGVPEDAPG